MGVTPAEKTEVLRTYVREQYTKLVEAGTTTYQNERKARIVAALGRKIERERHL